MSGLSSQPARRGSVVVIALWTIALAAIVASAIRLSAFRQATSGRETVARTQARWAARGGLEQTLSVMIEHTTSPIPEDARSMLTDLENVSVGELHHASYEVRNRGNDQSQPWAGPADEHARLNVNIAIESGLLQVFETFGLVSSMTFDLIDAARDWTDEDDDPSAFGVERDWYVSMPRPIEPRNQPIRSLAEFELIAGVWPKDFRGEDWNLNGRLDANEDDRTGTWPDYDDGDGRMRMGWAGFLTPYTVRGGPTWSGEPRIHLRLATLDEVTERLGVDDYQARTLILFGRNAENRIEDLITTPLTNIDASGTAQESGVNAGVAPLTDEQLRAVLVECQVRDPLDREPGKMNINFVDGEFLRAIVEGLGLDPLVADEIISLRAGTTGITHILDLEGLQSLAEGAVAQDSMTELARHFDTVSSVFTVSTVGRSAATGQEVEIIAVVDRSTIPIRILEYREQ